MYPSNSLNKWMYLSEKWKYQSEIFKYKDTHENAKQNDLRLS